MQDNAYEIYEQNREYYEHRDDKFEHQLEEADDYQDQKEIEE
jgi:hypothetical protein